jgi:hypothetical protein
MLGRACGSWWGHASFGHTRFCDVVGTQLRKSFFDRSGRLVGWTGAGTHVAGSADQDVIRQR